MARVSARIRLHRLGDLLVGAMRRLDDWLFGDGDLTKHERGIRRLVVVVLVLFVFAVAIHGVRP